MHIDQGNLHQKRIRLLSEIATKKLFFLYFYINGFCILTDGQNFYRMEALKYEESALDRRNKTSILIICQGNYVPNKCS